MTNEGLDRWGSFTMIEFTDFVDITKSASRHTAPFTIGFLRFKGLKALKFWIEDKLRMNEPSASVGFTRAVLTEYTKLYASAVSAKK